MVHVLWSLGNSLEAAKPLTNDWGVDGLLMMMMELFLSMLSQSPPWISRATDNQ
ncbi:3031_t:CDS:2 [Funneliformis caledonium]|uniref:3031_t:CDS:1 n=1 Tax=Funneliformis caledonium TaxID=1117310 RepID=A0A9N9D1W4_9GLOM|nr:3031_t:CDS:2 [Funneliformis caledonium]